MKYFVAFFHCQIVGGYYVSFFTFKSKSGVFTDDQIKDSIANLMASYYGFWHGQLIITKTVRVTKKEYDRISSEMK
jgi:lysophospholipid acyltransferase (LPLAT)-like uncharacterized protein